MWCGLACAGEGSGIVEVDGEVLEVHGAMQWGPCEGVLQSGRFAAAGLWHCLEQ